MGIKFSGSDAGGFRFDFSGANSTGGGEGSAAPKRERKPRKAVGSPGKRIAINTLVTLLVGAVYFYVELPAINLHAEEFYGFALLLCAVYCGCALLTSGFQGEGAKGYFSFVKKQCTVPFFLAAGLLALAVVGSAASWVVFRAGSYQKLLTVQSGDFSSEIAEVAYDRIPRSTTTAAPCASPRCATATSSSGSTTARRACPLTSSSTWSIRAWTSSVSRRA